MDNNNTTVTCGCGSGFTGLLTIAFIVLKLCGVISWSWWWVFSPIWISVGLALVSLTIVIIIATIVDSYVNIRDDKEKKKRRKAERK
jgi:membrane protein YdbS with pleckstrin-like domain